MLKYSSKVLKFCTENMGTIARAVMRVPGTLNLINTSRVVKPVVLKSKDICFRDISTNLHSARQMIRSDPSKGQDKREGKWMSMQQK
jgi:hypothetical protein